MATPPRDERGRFQAIEHRALRPGSVPHEDTPNGNVPPASDPNTVGPPLQSGGDPNGVEIVASDGGGSSPPLIHASRWDGWPDPWFPPIMAPRVAALSDVAWSCLDLNSRVFGAMPPYLLGASDGLPRDWLTNPDPDQYGSWSQFARQLLWDFQMGEAFVVCTARYANGWPARFHLAPPWTVSVDWRNGSRSYTIGSVVVPPEDILHLPYQMSVDELHGHGPLEVGATRMLAAQILSRYAANFAASGGMPPSWLEHPDELTAKQSNDLRDQWVTARMEGLGIPAVLSGGVTLHTASVDALSSALAELAAFEESRVAVLLGVPPFLVGLPSGGDSMTYSNVSAVFDGHWRLGLKPLAEQILPALSGWLTPRGTTLEVNRDEYVRPGPLERAQTYAIYISSGVLTPEEVRIMERFVMTNEHSAVASL